MGTLFFYQFILDSNSYICRLWDARKIQQIPVSVLDPEEEGAIPSPHNSDDVQEADFNVVGRFLASKRGATTLRGEHSSQKSTSSAYWDPSGRRIVSTSYDDTLRGELHISCSASC